MTMALDPAAITAPRLKEALAYWRTKLGDRAMPSRRDIDPAEIPQLLPYVMLTDVLSDPLDFRYRLIGTGIRGISWNDYTGKRYSEVPGKGQGSVVWAHCVEVVRSKTPLVAATPYIGPDQHVSCCETLLLPLSQNGSDVNMILQVVDAGLRPARTDPARPSSYGSTR